MLWILYQIYQSQQWMNVCGIWYATPNMLSKHGTSPITMDATDRSRATSNSFLPNSRLKYQNETWTRDMSWYCEILYKGDYYDPQSSFSIIIKDKHKLMSFNWVLTLAKLQFKSLCVRSTEASFTFYISTGVPKYNE